MEKRPLDYHPQDPEKRNVDRPRNTKRSQKEWAWDKTKELSKNRVGWRVLVDALCPPRFPLGTVRNDDDDDDDDDSSITKVQTYYTLL